MSSCNDFKFINRNRCAKRMIQLHTIFALQCTDTVFLLKYKRTKTPTLKNYHRLIFPWTWMEKDLKSTVDLDLKQISYFLWICHLIEFEERQLSYRSCNFSIWNSRVEWFCSFVNLHFSLLSYGWHRYSVWKYRYESYKQKTYYQNKDKHNP